MKTSISILIFAFAFCGLGDKLKQMSAGGGNANSNVSSPAKSSNGGPAAEPAKPTSAQQAIIDGGVETVWKDQGISWRLPAGWSKMEVNKDSFNYQGKDADFLLVSVSTFNDSFPMETSLQAYYDQAIQQMKNGKYTSAKMVTIDGIPGVEFVEASPNGKDDPQRHQWIAYRRYLGAVQQLNVMTSTKAANFGKHTDDFTAILYSMKQQ
ncbi:MAG TPA: hypothetical protein VL501_05980 [Pyrinomonadaceae bacterium]|nr:hypothetical protein [Pyrinomonadaceae bacterium]